MEENQNPTPLSAEALAKEGPVILSETKDQNLSSTLKPASKFSIKAITSIIIFLLLAGGAAAGYVYREPIMSMVAKPTPTPVVIQISPTPTPDPTADWQTYTNTEYNFSFKYPSSFTLVKEGKQVFKSTTLDKESTTIHQYNLSFTNGKMVQYDSEYPPSKDSSYLGINVELTNGKTISDLYDNKKTNFGITKVTHLDVSGNSDEVAEVSNIENTLRFYRKGDILVSFTSSQDGPGEIDKYREQILSTFKFTNVQTVDTSNWKTYKNSEYLYSIKYPKDWDIGVAGEANPETFPSPFISSFCDYQKGTLCSQINIGVSIPKDSNDLTPGFIVDDKIYNKSQIIIDGEKASEFDWFDSDYNTKGRIMHVVVTQKGEYKYSITYEESQKNQLFRTPKDWKDRTTFDQILSTFKFTK